MKKITYLFLASLLFSTLSAQDLKRVQRNFFPNPTDLEINTPIASKKRGYTTFKEMKEYLINLQASIPAIVQLNEVGKTQKGKEILLVKLTNNQPSTTKMRLLYTARVHGDEPGSTEGLLYFIEKMASDASMQYLLEKIDFYILPMVNVDGGQRMSRQTANGIDLNRDQVRLETPEAVALRKVVNEVDPHVCIDFHEYQPLKSAYSLLSSEILSLPWDVMFLTTGNPNVATPIRNSVETYFLPEAEKALMAKKHTSHTYYTPKSSSNGVVMNLGGTSPRSTMNSFALNNAFSILTETRGIGLGRAGIMRRIENIYTLAESFAKTTYNHSNTLLEAIELANKELKTVAVEFLSEKIEDYSVPFINQLKNRLDTVEVAVSNGLQVNITHQRELPASYLILPEQVKAIETLHKLGIETEVLTTATQLEVEAFKVIKTEEEKNSFKTFTPVKVATAVEKQTRQFPAGTHMVKTNQKRTRLLAVMLEPESSNGFVNYKIIEVQEGEEIPVYRLMD